MEHDIRIRIPVFSHPDHGQVSISWEPYFHTQNISRYRLVGDGDTCISLLFRFGNRKREAIYGRQGIWDPPPPPPSLKIWRHTSRHILDMSRRQGTSLVPACVSPRIPHCDYGATAVLECVGYSYSHRVMRETNLPRLNLRLPWQPAPCLTTILL